MATSTSASASASALREADGASPWIFWKTCVREVAFGYEGSDPATRPFVVESSDQVFRGVAAYAFILEVISGLQSPLAGETEILGQFRALFQNFNFESLSWGAQLRAWVGFWFADAKLIRQNFLEGAGSQSYGSVVRRLARDRHGVSFLGAGLLVQEILPWVQKEHARVNVFARQPEKVRANLGERSTVQIKKWTPSARAEDLRTDFSGEVAEVLVVAAPVPALLVNAVLSVASGVQLVIDLRGESGQDRISLPPGSSMRLVELAQVFEQAEQSKKNLQEKIMQARQKVDSLSQNRWNAQQVRPFGWDDLCA
jgi:glutamyl-tRNA reductase